MDKQIRDKFLTEAMGECWHEFDVNSPARHENWDGFAIQYSGHWNDCTKCGEDHIEEVANNSGFDTWAGFGKLWEWSKTQEWWADFMSRDVDAVDFYESLIEPDHYADAIYELLSESV